MNKHFLKSLFIAFMAISTTFGFIACNKEAVLAEDTTLETVTDGTLYALEQRGNLGSHGCYDLVFPVTIKFSDGTTKTITSQDSLRKSVKKWHKQHDSTRSDRPQFVYPIQVTAEDGSVITVDDEAELKALKAACKKTRLDSLVHRDSLHHKGFPRHDSLCFTIVFPISVKKADSTVVTIASKEELKALGHTEKGRGRGHGKKHGIQSQLQIVFPITIIKADGSKVTITSSEELKALRQSCH